MIHILKAICQKIISYNKGDLENRFRSTNNEITSVIQVSDRKFMEVNTDFKVVFFTHNASLNKHVKEDNYLLRNYYTRYHHKNQVHS